MYYKYETKIKNQVLSSTFSIISLPALEALMIKWSMTGFARFSPRFCPIPITILFSKFWSIFCIFPSIFIWKFHMTNFRKPISLRTMKIAWSRAIGRYCRNTPLIQRTLILNITLLVPGKPLTIWTIHISTILCTCWILWNATIIFVLCTMKSFIATLAMTIICTFIPANFAWKLQIHQGNEKNTSNLWRLTFISTLC